MTSSLDGDLSSAHVGHQLLCPFTLFDGASHLWPLAHFNFKGVLELYIS